MYAVQFTFPTCTRLDETDVMRKSGSVCELGLKFFQRTDVLFRQPSLRRIFSKYCHLIFKLVLVTRGSKIDNRRRALE